MVAPIRKRGGPTSLDDGSARLAPPVNPDAIAQNELGDWNDAATVLRAAQLATERREACLREGRSLAFETVFSAVDKPAFVRQALALGSVRDCY